MNKALYVLVFIYVALGIVTFSLILAQALFRVLD